MLVISKMATSSSTDMSKERAAYLQEKIFRSSQASQEYRIQNTETQNTEILHWEKYILSSLYA